MGGEWLGNNINTLYVLLKEREGKEGGKGMKKCYSKTIKGKTLEEGDAEGLPSYWKGGG